MSTLVMKFGGTSTGSAYALDRAAELVIAQIGQWDHIIVVVSAMDGVTNMLLGCSELARSSDITAWKNKAGQIRSKLEGVVRIIFAGDESRQRLLGLIDQRMEEITVICQQIQAKGIINSQELDEIAALGERINAHIFSSLLSKRGVLSQAVEATNLIVTDTCYQSASPIQPETNSRIKTVLSPLLVANIIPVVTGFIGATPDGITTTLGRGGSDFTAVIIGNSLVADEVWIWTDVDGIMSADPKLTPKAKLIPEISYQEIYKLSYYGAKVLHPKSILPASEVNIPIWVKNTFNPGCAGTRVSNSYKSATDSVTAITGFFNVNLFSVQVNPGRELLKSIDLIHKSLAKRGINVLHSIHQEDEHTVSFAFDEKDTKRVVQAFKGASFLRSSDNRFSQVQSKENLAIIAIIGQELHTSILIQSKVSMLLEKIGICKYLMDRDATPNCLVYLVEMKDATRAIKKIHDEVILHEQLIPFKNPAVLKHQPAL